MHLVCAETALIEQLKSLPKPLGVWAVNDIFGRAVYTLCGDLGLAIPDVVKVLGVDDMQIARASRPPLSSIRTPREQIGRSAMQTLQKMLDGHPGPPKPTVVPATELVAAGVDRRARLTMPICRRRWTISPGMPARGPDGGSIGRSDEHLRSSLHEHFQRIMALAGLKKSSECGWRGPGIAPADGNYRSPESP